MKMDSYGHPDADVRYELTEKVHEKQAGLIAEEVPTGIDLLVMPESSFAPLQFTIDDGNQEKLIKMRGEFSGDLLVGALRLEVDSDAGSPGSGLVVGHYNSAFFVPGGGMPAPELVQDKMRLVPFGDEY